MTYSIIPMWVQGLLSVCCASDGAPTWLGGPQKKFQPHLQNRERRWEFDESPSQLNSKPIAPWEYNSIVYIIAVLATIGYTRLPCGKNHRSNSAHLKFNHAPRVFAVLTPVNPLISTSLIMKPDIFAALVVMLVMAAPATAVSGGGFKTSRPSSQSIQPASGASPTLPHL